MKNSEYDFILVGYSSNSGGGRSGLFGLLKAIPADLRALALVDSRLKGEVIAPSHVELQFVAPTFLSRFFAERGLCNKMTKAATLLRLGSLPPLFRLRGRTFVFFENRHLLFGESLAKMPWSRKLRVWIERLWLHTFATHADTFVVQSQTVAEDLKKSLGRPNLEIRILPFQDWPGGELQSQGSASSQKRVDFFYPSSGDPHKNHHNLVQAWIELAKEGHRPSLWVTLDPKVNCKLISEIESAVQSHKLQILNKGTLSPSLLQLAYLESRAVIFPSNCESFGRPLAEAQLFQLPVLASELDFVRDLFEPAQTFDPSSPRSIARAVKRHLGLGEARPEILSGRQFVNQVLGR